MPKLSSPVTWIGGKGKFLSHLLPLLNPRSGESIYCEPFGGSGVVLMNKDPHPCEVYNDTDSDLVNLFRVLRDPDGAVHLWWELINTPVSREEFGDALAAKGRQYSPSSPVERAAAFVTRCRQRFGGGVPGSVLGDSDRSWGTARGSSRGMSATVSRWLSALEDYPAIRLRLATVVVDHQDAVRCAGQWDSPSTLFYIDPPYVGHEACYDCDFDEKAHRHLAAALNKIAGRAVVSYYPCDLVDELYPREAWRRIEVKVLASACGNKKRDPNGEIPARKKGIERTELILVNFDPRTRRRLHHPAAGSRGKG